MKRRSPACWPDDSEMAARIWTHDWHATSLGPLETWPGSVKCVLDILLRLPVPAVLLYGADSVVIYNDAYAAFAGLRPTDRLGHRAKEVLPDNDGFIDAVIMRGMAGESFSYRNRELLLYRHGAMERIWLDTHCSAVADDGGHPVGVLLMIVETTDRVRTENALRMSEARFRAFAEASPALIWQLDPGGTVVYVNPRFLEVTGWPAERLLGMPWQELLHPDDAADYAQALEQALEQAQQARKFNKRRIRAKSRDGAWRWFESYASPWFTDSGEYAGHVGISIDITGLMHTQQELAISNERLKLAIEGSGDAVWDWDIANQRLLHTARLKAMLGFSERDEFGSTEEWRQSVHPDDLPNVLVALDACLYGGSSTYRSEHRTRCKDGSWKWMLARGVVVARDEKGRALRMTGTLTDISEKRRSEEVIWRHANFDILTGLPNRRLFRDRLDHEIRKASRTGLPLALLFIDLDRFKEANDLLGHDAGDRILVEAAARISGCVRESDTVARLGGDEFTAILCDLDDVAHVELIAQKINEALATPFHVGSDMAYLSGSIGITLYPADAATPEQLMRNADQAMYVAKNAGRNQFNFFTRSMQRQAYDRLRMIAELRRAISEKQLKVYFQPMVNLSTGRVDKAEALVRWLHPRLGMIEPTDFIPLAEESGLINNIGDWVFTEAAAWSRQWHDRLGKSIQIAVNKSAVQFLSRHEGVHWPGYLKGMGLPDNSVSIEISEDLLLNASTRVANQLLQYRDAGIQVAINDFGIGYSSMAYLKKFDIDYLKIDQSFVRKMTASESDRAIVRSVSAMAHELGLKVIAAGIETSEQKNMLLDAKCDFGQGFLFSKALPPEKFEKVLLN